MGLRKDLDKVNERFIYYLMNGNTPIYVGTSRNPRSRYQNHLKKIKEKNTAPVYVFCNENNILPTLKIVSKIVGYYSDAEKVEISHIQKHATTILNFYNNPLSKNKVNNKSDAI
jgi:hypothetical protein